MRNEKFSFVYRNIYVIKSECWRDFSRAMFLVVTGYAFGFSIGLFGSNFLMYLSISFSVMR